MIFALALAASAPSAAEPPDEPSLTWVALPMFGGDSDLGFVMGLATVISKPSADDDFIWQLQTHNSTSLKSRGEETFWPLQRHFLRFEKPHFMGRVALWAEARFERILDAGYYGLETGTVERLPPPPNPTFYQYQSTEPHLRGYLSGAVWARSSWRWLSGLDIKYAEALAPAQSRLDLDRDSSERLLGAAPHWTLQPWLGLAYDTRDRRFGTRAGSNHLITLRGSPGLLTPELRFAGVSALMRQYTAITERTVVAYRIWLDALFGDVPFEELARGGDLRQTRMIGHSRSLRGVPWGRVHAPYKAMGTLELRQTLISYRRANKPPLKLKLNIFAEAGRGWWQPDEPGAVAWTLGWGPRFVLGPGVDLRIDWAYSPSSEPLEGSVFTGFYVDLGEVL
ncbi:MAG: hypothetical protein VYB65_04635 [Myxococcota bacterium]|nr:hypothetical protein [Myxococcota bacterium]